MENNKSKPIIIGSVVFAALLIIALLLTIGSVKKANKSLNDEKLRSEQLTAEKTQLTADLDKTKADLATLKSQYDENEKLLAETKSKLDAAEKRARSLSSQAAAYATAKKELETLQQTKAGLEQQLSSLKSEYDKLLARSNELQAANTRLEQEKKQLEEQLAEARTFDADNMMVTAVRGKTTEKIVAVARRAKKLNIAFDVPKSLTENISFKITTPGGQTLTAENSDISWKITENAGNLTASLSPVTGLFEESRQVTLTYTPSAKLAPGIYSIELLCQNKAIGHCRIKLR